ncbi:hypothetical protein HDU97_008784, partial [Phlyctochytrium planicorne]
MSSAAAGSIGTISSSASGSSPGSANSTNSSNSNSNNSNNNNSINNGGTILICRNKHFPYIASYHGPWLSLPHELFQSLIDINNSTKPHPIDVTVFRNLLYIRKLVDEAADLAIRAMSSAPGPNFQGSHNGHQHDRGFGRVSHLRQNRLRELAVAKLALAYRIDEIATSVLAMQSASALDEIASKVLKKNSSNMDALYVHFFHEKIPSRMLAESTTTAVIDRLIENQPGVPAYYRTRAMIHGFREDYPLALKDFKTAISMVKRRQQHVGNADDSCCENQLVFLRGACYHQYALSLMEKAIQTVNKKHSYNSNKPASGKGKRNEIPFAAIDYNPEFSAEYMAALDKSSGQVVQLIRKSVRDYCTFLAAYPEAMPPFPHPPSTDTPVSGSPPLTPVKANPELQMQIASIVSLPDFVKLLPARTHGYTLPSLQNDEPPSNSNVMSSNAAAIANSAAVNSASANSNAVVNVTAITAQNGVMAEQHTGKHNCCPGCLRDLPNVADKASTYHPLLVEAWFVIGINYLLLGEWQTAVLWHERIVQMQNLIEGYPVFLPARSMGQADYIEILRKLRTVFRPSPEKENTTNGKEKQPVALITGPETSPVPSANGKEAEKKPQSQALVKKENSLKTKESNSNLANGGSNNSLK